MSDGRRIAPHVARNAAPIIEVLRGVLPDRGLVLEVASGSGEHALHFAQTFPALTFQPSDPDPEALASIEAWRQAEGPANLLPPVHLDAAADAWPIDRADALLCINMVHISPWPATIGLMKNAALLLAPGGLLYLYGPYREKGLATAESNESFDRSLKTRNPAWGLRWVEDVAEEGGRHGFALEERVAMPANNLSLIFRRS